ncbi:hypothetical protein M9H77_02410 [Catharanthus roseus]|uniref:Uncharacterized protein n=1 Tax=Catharanthus roseus TaxID=4058 RepID=A0ACC0C8Q6_CATRO|nr:hypothetical protein M9H77_02410 [Catharanthus roseus]
MINFKNVNLDETLSMFLRHLFQHGRCVPLCAMNAISLENIGTTIVYLCKRRKLKIGRSEECCEHKRKVQPQFLNFLTTTCTTKSNHWMKVKGGGVGKELSIGYEDTSISLSLNPFSLEP